MTDPITGTIGALCLAARWRLWVAPRWRAACWRDGTDLRRALRQVTRELPTVRRWREVAGRLVAVDTGLPVHVRPADPQARLRRRAARVVTA